MKSKLLTLSVGTVMALNLFAPAVILAQVDKNANRPTNIVATKEFCTKLSEISARVGQKLTDREAKLGEKRTERLGKLDARKQERETKLAERRSQWDANRAEHLAKLERKAKTESQKQAVASFKTAVETAIANRRAAIDAAIETFKQGVEQAITDKKTAIDSAVTTLKNSLKAAEEKAKADCANGVNPQKIKEDLQASIKTAREKFNSDRKAVEKMGTSMETLIAARKHAIEQAIQDFKAAMEKARADFKAAMKQARPVEGEATTTPEATPEATTNSAE